MNPQKLNGLNYKALKSIVVEFAPIYQHFRWILDGPSEAEKVAIFGMFLMCRIAHKPELEAILNITR